MKQALLQFFRDERGATAIEYGLIAGLIAVAIIGSVTVMGDSLERAYQSLAASLSRAFPATTSGS